MKKNKISLGKLFYNNKVVLIVSIALSFIFWIRVSTSSSEINSMMISDIPITINLSESAKESGLVVFGSENAKAQVTVTGNRLILGQLSKNDIQIVAQQAPSIINTPDNYTLELTARKNSLLSDYEITSSVSPHFITVMVDRARKVTFDIKDNIKYSADPNYFVTPVSLSQTSVTISGPESRILEIDKVVAEGEIKGTINTTTALNNIPLTLYDAAGNKLSPSNMTFSVTTVDATVSVLNRKKVKILSDISGVPNGLNLSSKISIFPDSIEIAGSDATLENLESIKLKAIDFSQISTKNNKFELPFILPTGCKTINNENTALLKFDTSGMTMKKITTNKIHFVNVADDKTAGSNNLNLSIEVVGPINQIRNLTDNDIFVQVDLKDKPDFVGQTEMEATVIFNKENQCWFFGEYKVNVIVTKK